MKIRKVFESVKSYEKISSWHDGERRDLVPINGTERDKLIVIFSPMLRRPEKPLTGNGSQTKVICGKSVNRVDIDILCDNDEWYHVRIISMNGSHLTTHSYFKCDQWDGLIDCIKNEVIDKIGK